MGRFPESRLAHRYLDGLKGIEIGGSAHNAFSIDGCINVDYTSEHTAHKQAELDLCGTYLPIDIVADAHDLPFKDNEWEFVLNSHMLEHAPNPLAVIKEWVRVLKDKGIIYFVIPRKDDNPEDAIRGYTDYDHVLRDFVENQTVETHECLPGQGPRGHYHMWHMESFKEMLSRFFGSKIGVIDSLEYDDKVGNGFTVVCRVNK